MLVCPQRAVSHVTVGCSLYLHKHVAAVPSPSSIFFFKMAQRVMSFLGPLTCCGLHLCLFGSQFLDESQIRWSSSRSVAEARHAQGLVNIIENCPICLMSGPSSGHELSSPKVCYTLPVASCGNLTEPCGRFKRSRTAGSQQLRDNTTASVFRFIH